jgi:hypothetical protein
VADHDDARSAGKAVGERIVYRSHKERHGMNPEVLEI